MGSIILYFSCSFFCLILLYGSLWDLFILGYLNCREVDDFYFSVVFDEQEDVILPVSD